MQGIVVVAAKAKSRFAKAKKSLREMKERIAPYVKPRKYKQVSTRGRWRNSLATPPKIERQK